MHIYILQHYKSSAENKMSPDVCGCCWFRTLALLGSDPEHREQPKFERHTLGFVFGPCCGRTNDQGGDCESYLPVQQCVVNPHVKTDSVWNPQQFSKHTNLAAAASVIVGAADCSWSCCRLMPYDQCRLALGVDVPAAFSWLILELTLMVRTPGCSMSAVGAADRWLVGCWQWLQLLVNTAGCCWLLLLLLLLAAADGS